MLIRTRIPIKAEAVKGMSSKLKSLYCLQVFSSSHLSHIGYLNRSRARNNFCWESFFSSSPNKQQQADRAKEMFWFVLVSQGHPVISQLFSACRCQFFLPSSTSYSNPPWSVYYETPRLAHKTCFSPFHIFWTG